MSAGPSHAEMSENAWGNTCALRVAIGALIDTHPDRAALAKRFAALTEGVAQALLNQPVPEAVIREFERETASLGTQIQCS